MRAGALMKQVGKHYNESLERADGNGGTENPHQA